MEGKSWDDGFVGDGFGRHIFLGGDLNPGKRHGVMQYIEGGR